MTIIKSFNQVLSEQRKDPEFEKAYKEAEREYISFKNVVKARECVGLTQGDVAVLMGTTQSAVARLERNLASGILPSHNSLTRYAKALGKRVVVNFL